MPRSSSARPPGVSADATLFVAYLRVSTRQQGDSGLGLEAQRAKVAETVARLRGVVIHELEEVESGTRNDRPQLREALALCRRYAATLVVSRLDRLARNARFLLEVRDNVGPGGVVFCDLPELPSGPAGQLVLTILGAVAEYEAKAGRQRTLDGLAAKKRQGFKLGNPNLRAANGPQARARQARKFAREVWPAIARAQRAGCKTLRELGDALEAVGIRTPSGSEHWAEETVRRVIARAQGSGEHVGSGAVSGR
jgi:DNA invertase Pin-like site-specific DNA recombinase